jgi:acyl carrier protein
MNAAPDLSTAREVLAGVLDLPSGTLSDNSSIGNVEEWDSLAHVRLVFEIERRLKRELSPIEIADIASVADIDRVLAGDAA